MGRMPKKTEFHIWDTAGRCPNHDKANFRTRRAAKQFAKRIRKRNGRMTVYQCGEYFHIGHLPRGIARGTYTRDQLGRDQQNGDTP